MTDSMISQLAEMRLYFTTCTINAAPGSAAHKRFTGYFAALDKAIAELKEQDAVMPLCRGDMMFCGSCRYAIPKTVNYCPQCRRKVKWNDG